MDEALTQLVVLFVLLEGLVAYHDLVTGKAN